MNYLAFISYSSVDREQALWLHRELEAYRIPKHLVALSAGAVPAGLRPIFYDRLELAASADLPRSIRKALDDSQFLIVLCSPAACRSRWVNEEVLTFKRMGRADRILPVILDGEPDAKSRGAPDEQECFPAALTGSLDDAGNLLATPRLEPLAADMRPAGDKRENAKLKVIAGLLGVGFDALVQREVRAANARARHARMIANRVQRSQSLFLSSLSRQQSEAGTYGPRDEDRARGAAEACRAARSTAGAVGRGCPVLRRRPAPVRPGLRAWARRASPGPAEPSRRSRHHARRSRTVDAVGPRDR